MWVRSLGGGRSLGDGHGNPLQSSCLENPKDRGAWWATVHGPNLTPYYLLSTSTSFFQTLTHPQTSRSLKNRLPPVIFLTASHSHFSEVNEWSELRMDHYPPRQPLTQNTALNQNVNFAFYFCWHKIKTISTISMCYPFRQSQTWINICVVFSIT